MKRRFVWLGFAAITIGLFVLVYHGPGRAVLRGHAGDILMYAIGVAICVACELRWQVVAPSPRCASSP